MRKQLKLLLLVATVLALFVMAMIVGSAEGNVCKNTTTGTEYADFLAACTAAQSGETIQLLADVTVTAANKDLPAEKQLTIDGAYGENQRYKLTINSTSKNLFQVAAANVKVTFKNLVIDVKNTKAKYGIAGGSTDSANFGVAFDNCKIDCQNAGVIRSGRMIVSINDCEITSPGAFVLNNNAKNYETNISVTGDTQITITKGSTGFTSGNGCNLTIGKKGANNNNISITVPTTLLVVADPATPANNEQTGSLTVWGGTITVTDATNGMIVANGGEVNINGGTFVSTASGKYLFGSTVDDPDTTDTVEVTTAVISISIGSFEFGENNLGTYFDATKTWSSATLKITGWTGFDTTITDQDEYTTVMSEIDEIITECKELGFNIETNLSIGLLPVVTGDVTLTDVNTTVKTYVWLTVEAGGTLTLNNCNITVADGADVYSFVKAVGNNITLTVNGGTYDMTGTRATEPLSFDIGTCVTDDLSVANSGTSASFSGVDIFGAGIRAEYIKSLTVTDCFISFTNKIAEGEIANTTEASQSKNAPISSDAIKTTISDTTIYAGTGTGIKIGCKDNVAGGATAPDVTITRVTIYARQGIAFFRGTTTLTGATIKAHPVDNRHASLRLMGAVTVNVVGGTFDQTDKTTSTALHLFQLEHADAELNLSENVRITSYMGNVFNFKNAAGKLTVEDCYITVCGTAQSIVNDAAGTSTITLTSCTFVVEKVQQKTEGEVTTPIELFVGTIEFNDVVVLAKEGTLVQGTAITEYALDVRYRGSEETYKLWTANAGDFENSADAGAAPNKDYHGLKFDTKISSTVINGFIEKTSKSIKDIRFYTLIAPMDYVAKAGGVFTKEALDTALGSGKTNYVAIEAVNTLAGFDAETNTTIKEAVIYGGTLISLKSDTRIYAAVSMIVFEYTDDTTDTFYGDFCSADNARTYDQVAVAAAAN